jgi:hypothetical protein
VIRQVLTSVETENMRLLSLYGPLDWTERGEEAGTDAQTGKLGDEQRPVVDSADGGAESFAGVN